MASSSKKSAAKANLLGKRGPKDGLETKSVLKKLRETTKVFADSLQQIEGKIELLETNCDQANVKEVALRNNRRLLAYLSPKIEISDIINFFEDVGQVVCVQLVINQLCQRTPIGMVEFASANEAKKALEKKNGEYLCGNKIALCLVLTFLPKYCIDHKVWYKESLSAPLPAPPRVVKNVLFVANLSPQTNTWHLNFFEYDVREAVSVRLIVNCEGKHVRKNLLIEEDERVKRNQETPGFLEAVAIRKKTLVVYNISSQNQIPHIINFFKDVGEVVHVRLIVNHNGMHEGYCFVEFASANEAKKALKKKNGAYLHNYESSNRMFLHRFLGFLHC